jgi:hypothetical protein
MIGQFTSFCIDFNSLLVTQTVSLRRFVATNLRRSEFVNQPFAVGRFLSFGRDRKLTVCFTSLLVTQLLVCGGSFTPKAFNNLAQGNTLGLATPRHPTLKALNK